MIMLVALEEGPGVWDRPGGEILPYVFPVLFHGMYYFIKFNQPEKSKCQSSPCRSRGNVLLR